MTQHPFVVHLKILTGGYEKAVALAGQARTEDEAITMALAAEAHNELDESEHKAGFYIDDCFIYGVNSVQQIPWDEYQVTRKYIGAF